MKITSETIPTSMAVAATVWVATVSTVLYAQYPVRAWPLLAAAATLIVGWVFAFLNRPPPDAKSESSARRGRIIEGIGFAGFLMGAALTDKLLALHSGAAESGQDLAMRSQGLVMGTIVMFYANSIPKKLVGGCSLQIKRMAGWALFLGGLGVRALVADTAHCRCKHSGDGRTFVQRRGCPLSTEVDVDPKSRIRTTPIDRHSAPRELHDRYPSRRRRVGLVPKA